MDHTVSKTEGRLCDSKAKPPWTRTAFPVLFRMALWKSVDVLQYMGAMIACTSAGAAAVCVVIFDAFAFWWTGQMRALPMSFSKVTVAAEWKCRTSSHLFWRHLYDESAWSRMAGVVF